MKNILRLIAIITGTLVLPHGVRACSCTCKPFGDGGPRAMARHSAVIFVGEVTDVQGPTDAESHKGYYGVGVTFRVEQYWKGVRSHVIVVHTRLWCCNPTLDKGRRYLVYAVGKKLETGCTRTRPITDADEDLRELGPANTPAQIQ